MASIGGTIEWIRDESQYFSPDTYLMYDDTHLRVARSCTSYSDSLFSTIPFLTLCNYHLLGLPLLLPLPFPPPSFLRSAPVCITGPKHLSWTFSDILHTLFVPLILSFLLLSSSITPHIHRSKSHFRNLQFLFLCFLHCLHAICLCPIQQCWSYHCPVHISFCFQFVHVPPQALSSRSSIHSVGDFRIQFSILRQRRSQVFEHLSL